MNRFRNNRFNSNTTGINEDLKIAITKKLNEFINDETKRGIHSMLSTLK
jgi:aryl-phospho-beta-D-glucosidase BglC (GH1 family)